MIMLLSQFRGTIMEFYLNFDTPVSAFSVHPTQSNTICLGFLDGKIAYCTFEASNLQNKRAKSKEPSQIDEKWRKTLKKAVRAIKFSQDGNTIFVTSSNRAVCMFDTETGKKLRCIRQGHKSRPNVLSLLPSSISGQQFASGAENGEIKTWDFRQAKPQVCRFTDQEDIINSFSTWKNNLLAVSGDGTLASYDLHKRKMRIQSETMHSELLSLAVTNRFTYAGAADGHVEVFNNGEFGNILERIETPMVMGVEQLLALRDNLLLAAASTQEEMRFVHVHPNKCLGGIPYPGGVDLVDKTADSSLLLVTSSDGMKLTAYPLTQIVREVPELKAQEMGEFKRREKEEERMRKINKTGGDFFKDMLSEEEEDGADGDDDDDEEEED